MSIPPWLLFGSMAFNTLGSMFGQVHANNSNMDLFYMQKKHAMDMMNKQNEYNSPANQMQRIKDAGLNPALVYGGSGLSTSSANYQSPAAPQMQPITPVLDPSLLMQLKSLNLQEKLQDKQISNETKKTNAEVQYTQEKTRTEQLLQQKGEKELEGLDYSNKLQQQLLDFNSSMNMLLLDEKGLDVQQRKELFPLQKVAMMLSNEESRQRILTAKTMRALDAQLKGKQIEDLGFKNEMSKQELAFVYATSDMKLETFIEENRHNEAVRELELMIKQAQANDAKFSDNWFMRFASKYMEVMSFMQAQASSSASTAMTLKGLAR